MMIIVENAEISNIKKAVGSVGKYIRILMNYIGKSFSYG